MKLTLTRTIDLPDEVQLARYHRVPELGPKVLFFTGGTALKPLSLKLGNYTHNSIHLITPFDSGGSSAEIRRHFDMPAVGDIRNRIMALADRSVQGHHEILELFVYRLPKEGSQEKLRAMLHAMIDGTDERVRAIPQPMRTIVRNSLGFFREAMPDGFDLRGASIGNLILTGGYVNNRRKLDTVIYLFSMLVKARGQVRAVSNRDYQLAAELEDGSMIVGQHLLTGKEVPPVTSPVREVFIACDADHPEPVELHVRPKISKLIRGADLICYPMGSFYSSLVAGLLVKGVGDAIRDCGRPKVYIPNLGRDPELLGRTLSDSAELLLRYLRESCTEPTADSDLMTHILVDRKNGVYPGGVERGRLEAMGLTVIDAEMVSERSAPYLDEDRVLENILSLA